MHTLPFQIFGLQHIISLTLAALVIVALPLHLKHKSESTKYITKIVLVTLILAHEVMQVSYTFSFNYGWPEAFPFHMCDLSAFAISYFLFKGGRIFFNCAFFWGMGGATMALITPDVEYAYPNAEYLPFFYSHILLILTVCFTVVALKARPYLSDIPKVISVTLVGMVLIYIINLLLGEGANFWYLKNGPAGISIMQYLPKPPFHVLAFIPLVISVFYLTYLPFWIKDKLARPKTNLTLPSSSKS